MPCPWPVHCVEGSAQQPVTFFTLLIVMEALIVKIVVSLYGPVKKLYKQAEHMLEEALSKDDHPDVRREHMERMKRNRQILNRSEGHRTRTRRRLRLLKTMALVASKNKDRDRLFSLVKRTKDKVRLDSNDDLILLPQSGSGSPDAIDEQSSSEESTQVVPFTLSAAGKMTAAAAVAHAMAKSAKKKQQHKGPESRLQFFPKKFHNVHSIPYASKARQDQRRVREPCIDCG